MAPSPNSFGMNSGGALSDPTWRVRRRYFPAVEGMRGVAAICVLVGHVLLFGYSDGPLHELGRQLAPFGLVIFFTISGFLLYRPFLAARQVGESVGELTPSYLWRRAVRILPAYWVALTLSTLWLDWDGVFTEHWWVYFGLLQNYSTDWILNGLPPAWSLCVERTFYLVLPAIALILSSIGLGSKRRRAVLWELGVFAAIILLSLAWRSQIGSDPDATVLDNSLLGCLGWFSLGMVLAAIGAMHPHVLAGVRRALANPRWCWTSAALLFVLVAVGITGKVGLATAGAVTMETVLLGLAAALLLAPAIFDERGTVVARLLENRTAVFLGTISYGIYLWHWAFLSWLNRESFVFTLPFPFAVLLAGTLLSSVAAGAASWYLVEKPLMKRARSVKAFEHRRMGAVEVADGS